MASCPSLTEWWPCNWKALSVTDIFIVNTPCWCPQASIIEGLGSLHLEGLPLEEAQEGSDRHSLPSAIRWVEIVPEEKTLLLQDVPEEEERSQGWLMKHSAKSKECIEFIGKATSKE